jgi:hypothetical protein
MTPLNSKTISGQLVKPNQVKKRFYIDLRDIKEKPDAVLLASGF